MLSSVGTYIGTSNLSSVTGAAALSSGDSAQASPTLATVKSSVRVVVDPSAGLVTQYLDSNGVVKSQVPSSVTVAYLRAGLTSDGLAPAVQTPSNSQAKVSTTA